MGFMNLYFFASFSRTSFVLSVEASFTRMASIGHLFLFAVSEIAFASGSQFFASFFIGTIMLIIGTLQRVNLNRFLRLRLIKSLELYGKLHNKI